MTDKFCTRRLQNTIIVPYLNKTKFNFYYYPVHHLNGGAGPFGSGWEIPIPAD